MPPQQNKQIKANSESVNGTFGSENNLSPTGQEEDNDSDYKADEKER